MVHTATLLMETALAFFCFAELSLGKFTGKDYVTEKIYNDNVASQDEGNDCTWLVYHIHVMFVLVILKQKAWLASVHIDIEIIYEEWCVNYCCEECQELFILYDYWFFFSGWNIFCNTSIPNIFVRRRAGGGRGGVATLSLHLDYSCQWIVYVTTEKVVLMVATAKSNLTFHLRKYMLASFPALHSYILFCVFFLSALLWY